MSTLGVYRKLGAPAAVVLATVVNVAFAGNTTATERELSSPQPDLSWALSGGATHAAQSTRAAIARNAVKNIHSQDRLGGAPALSLCATPLLPQRALADAALPARVQPHPRSTFQHSAP